MKINTICKDCSRNLQICTCMDDTIVPIKEFTIDELLKEYGKNLTESEVKLLTIKNKETLEEAAESLFPDSSIQKRIFIKGAKWQQEQQLPQQEISDEEIEKAAQGHFSGDTMWSERIAFKLAIKWYREQLKQRQ